MSQLRTPLKGLLDDPIDHARLEHARRRVAASRLLPPQRAWRWGPLAATAAVAIAALAVWSWQRPAPTAELALASGAPFVGTHAHDVALGDGSRIELERGTHVEVIENDATRVLLAQSDGRAIYDVHPGGPRRWSIDAGALTVDVIGTRFEIARAGERVSVRVTRGRVRVRGAAVLRTLTAGESIEVGAPAPIAAEPIATGSAEPSERPAVDAPIDEVAPIAPPRTAPRRAPSWRELASEGMHAEAYETLGQRGIDEAARTASSVDELLALADTARLSGHPGSALAPLQRVLDEHADDPRAGAAALTLGRLSLDVANDPARAVRYLERALELGVPPRLHDVALARLAEAYAGRGDAAQARASAERYLREHPDGMHAARMRQLASDAR